MKKQILSIAAKFEAANAIDNSDEKRKQWKYEVINLFKLMDTVKDESVYDALYSIWKSSQCANEDLIINALRWYAETLRPAYVHDCDLCEYCGTCMVNDTLYDFYTCNDTAIARYSDDPPSNLTWSLNDADNHHVFKHVLYVIR